MDSVVVIKVISALLYPLGLVSLCAGLALLLLIRGRVLAARCCSAIAVVILLLASNPMMASKLVYSLERQYPQRAIESVAKHDAIILLGGGLRIPTAPAKYAQLAHGSDRYWYAAKLYRAGKTDKILISGGNVYQQPGVKSEAYYISELLQQWGVQQEAIELESGSRTTAENQRNTIDLINKDKIHSALLVTSAIHMPRAYSLFRKLPIEITPASADVLIRQSNSPAIFRLIPSASALRLTTAALHEYYAMWFAALKSNLQ
ncbi:MAG: YdcF family protein [Arenicella sp.]|nr:YdcF family protein [Arenicella sp.]